MSGSNYVTPEEAAAQFGISVGTLADAVSQGTLAVSLHPETGHSLLKAADVAALTGNTRDPAAEAGKIGPDWLDNPVVNAAAVVGAVAAAVTLGPKGGGAAAARKL